MRNLAILMPIVLAACGLTEPAAPPAPPPQAAAAAMASPAPPPPRPAPRPPARRPAEAGAMPAPTPALWRVAADGTTGCADPAALRELRAAEAAAQPRRLAAARSAGGCVTVFRATSWRLAEDLGEILRLAPAEEASIRPLHFWRAEMAPEAP